LSGAVAFHLENVMALKSTGYVRAFGTNVTSTSYALTADGRSATKPAGFIAIGDNPEGERLRGFDAWVIGTGADGATGSVRIGLVFATLKGGGGIESYHWREYCTFDVALSTDVPGLGTDAIGSPACIKTTEYVADVLSALSVSAFATGLIASFQGVAPSVLSATDAEGVFTANDFCNAYGITVDLKCGTATSLNFVYRRNL
jgi:hypothetical protein